MAEIPERMVYGKNASLKYALKCTNMYMSPSKYYNWKYLQKGMKSRSFPVAFYNRFFTHFKEIHKNRIHFHEHISL